MQWKNTQHLDLNLKTKQNCSHSNVYTNHKFRCKESKKRCYMFLNSKMKETDTLYFCYK